VLTVESAHHKLSQDIPVLAQKCFLFKDTADFARLGMSHGLQVTPGLCSRELRLSLTYTQSNVYRPVYGHSGGWRSSLYISDIKTSSCPLNTGLLSSLVRQNSVLVDLDIALTRLKVFLTMHFLLTKKDVPP
jgi:hypothetical protein